MFAGAAGCWRPDCASVGRAIPAKSIAAALASTLLFICKNLVPISSLLRLVSDDDRYHTELAF